MKVKTEAKFCNVVAMFACSSVPYTFLFISNDFLKCSNASSYFPCSFKTEPIFCNVLEMVACSSVPKPFDLFLMIY